MVILSVNIIVQYLNFINTKFQQNRINIHKVIQITVNSICVDIYNVNPTPKKLCSRIIDCTYNTFNPISVITTYSVWTIIHIKYYSRYSIQFVHLGQFSVHFTKVQIQNNYPYESLVHFNILCTTYFTYILF